MADDPNRRPFEEEYWARLSPMFRRAHNRLRQTRGLPPIPEPKVDRYKPPRGSVRPVDPTDLEATVAAADFLGLNDPTRPWMRGAQGFASDRDDSPPRAARCRGVADRPRYLRTLTDEEFAHLSPAHRRLYNLLRRQHGRLPIPEPAFTDLSLELHVPPPKPFDNPSLRAREIAHTGDPEGVLFEKLKTEVDATITAFDSDPRALGVERPAHRPKRLRRKIAEHAAMTLFGVWDRLKPKHRRSLKTVLSEIKDGYGISRREAFRLLEEARKRAKHRRHTTH